MHKFDYSFLDNGMLPASLVNLTSDIYSLRTASANRKLKNDDLKNYKAEAEFYIRQHTDSGVISKLRGNIPLTPDDIKELEKILWSEVGTKQDYENEYGQKPLGELVREIVGLDMNAAKEAFSE